MPNEHVDWIRLEDVLAAADRCLAPIGPELAGFIVLETAHRLREIGGVVAISELAIGTSGHVALTAPPVRGDEETATRTLRALLGRLLTVSTSATPALRQCSKRHGQQSLALLCRELEAALIPLNRAASRRGLSRVARATVEAIDSGRLEPIAAEEAADIEPPPVELAARPRATPPPLPPRVERAVAAPVIEQEESIEIAVEPLATPTPVPAIDDKTPFCAPVFEDDVEPFASPYSESPSGFVVVSHLPPLATERPPTVAVTTPHPTFTFTVEQTPAPPKEDRVAKLIESFHISRLRDDPALSRDLKAMCEIETHAPPPVTVHVKMRNRRERSEELPIEDELPREPSVIIDDEPPPPLPKKRSGMMALLAVTTIACGFAAVAARPAALDAILGPPLPPPGDTPVAAAPTQIVTPRMPIVCEASLTLENVPAGAEVLRRIGVTPLGVAMPMHVPFDLVATMDGHVARRAHVDASAIWQKDATGARLDVPFALDATNTESKWPAASGVVPLRSNTDASRGLLRATSTPNGATLWIVVDPSSITGVPCGNAVDVMVVPSGGAQRTVHVDWAAFAGSPPRATARY